MELFLVEGGKPLIGSLPVQGAKISVLPLLAAALLANGPCELENAPQLSDVQGALDILQFLGAKYRRQEDCLLVDTSCANGHRIPEELMHKMRSSIVFLGAMLGRQGRAELSLPGGCDLGPRPIDLHLEGLRRLGVVVQENQGRLVCTAPQGLHGSRVTLAFPSVGATENILLAACTAKGETVLTNAAQEPEIVDLAGFLNAMGGKITGAGKSTLRVEGVKKLHPARWKVMPDRIAAATWLAMTCASRGKICLQDFPTHLLQGVYPVLEEMGAKLRLEERRVFLAQEGRPRRVKQLRTMPYPGFPTDAQSVFLAVLTAARGTSLVVENIFSDRFRPVGELLRMGADVRVEGRAALVHGVKQLYAAPVEATDLRGGAALVTAGLMAKGTTAIHGIHHIDRGYEHLEDTLTRLGASVRRVTEQE